MEAPQTTRGTKLTAPLILWKMLVYIASAYVIVCILFFIFQGQFIFFPNTGFTQTPASERWDFEEITVEVDGGVTHGWFVPTDQPRIGTILFSHGNAENIGDQIETIRPFRLLGFDTLVYDYAGYGQSTGRPTEKRVYDDIRGMYSWLTKVKGVSPKEIVLCGRSVGGGPTAQLATEVECAAVILESTFRSIAAMAAEVMPWIPRGPLVRYRFDNERKVKEINIPLLIVHSPKDSIIPFAHGQTLFEVANEPKQFLEVGGDHLEGHWITYETYKNGLAAFFTTVFGRAATENASPAALSPSDR